MLSIQRKGTGVLLAWCFIAVSVVYVAYIGGRRVFTVNGGYGEWSEFTSCSEECGGGAKTRVRTCTNPLPNYFGENCSRLGVPMETVKCNEQPCPINGQFGNWGEFGACSVSCGAGTMIRERKCDNPAPQYGGLNCQGEAKESKSCDEKPCPVNGGYGEWGEWSLCSLSCGSGVKRRSRVCDHPPPAHGGQSCTGASEETEKCNETPCLFNTTVSPTTSNQAKDNTA